MIESKIEGVSFQPLKVISDERGAVLHMLRNSDPFFKGFGEIYFSEINPGIVKAWKRNKKQTQNLAVPMGIIHLVIYDDRPNSVTSGVLFDCILGRPENYNLIRIPPFLWYGFQCLGEVPALIANCADRPHNNTESEKIDPNSDFIPHNW